MILIQKRGEPATWKAYRLTPGVIYAPSHDLRNALLAEQGYICAFCMRSIPVTRLDPGEAEQSKIAHLKSRANHRDHQLDYDNMVVCCPGNINGSAHCDKSQGPRNVTLPLFNNQLQQSIKYSTHDGEIKSSNVNWDTEINDVLHLNNVLLKYNRIQTLIGIRNVLETLKWRRAKIREKLSQWTSHDAHGRLKPYCGIVIWYLQKKLNQP